MRINVTVNEVQMIDSEILNVNEYNVHKCKFEFTEEYEGLTKKAVFTNKDGQAYLQTIVNDECNIPSEVLDKKAAVEIGVYAYEMNGQELALRYSPKPTKAYIDYGSYKEAENSTPPTPSEVEQLQAQITENANDIDTLETNIAGITTDVSDIKTEQITQNTNIQTNSNNVATNTGDIADIKAEQTQQNTKIQNNTDDILNLQTNKADKSEIPTKVSELDNDSNFIDKSVNDLDNYTKSSQLSTVATTGNYNDLSNKPSIPTKTSDLTNDSGFITKNVNDLTNYTLKTNTGSLIDLEINQSTYVITLSLKDQDGNVISTDTIDLPLESVVVGGNYDSVNKKIVLTLENGNTVDIPVGDLVAGLQTEITSSNKLASDLVDDTNSGNKFVNTSEKQIWNGKYAKPVGGIPKTDLDSNVQTSLGKAETAIQEHQDLTDYVKNTDYATTDKGGVVKSNDYYNAEISSVTGIIFSSINTYAQYQNKDDRAFIGKGTLENVIVGKELINEPKLNASQQLQDELIEELQQENEDLRNALPSVSGQGTNIKLEGTAKARFKKFVIGGNTEQAQYEGKNLADDNYSNYTTTGGTYGYKKLIEDFTKTYLVVSIVDKKPTTPLSAGIYLGFTGNGIDFTEGGNWIIANSEISNTNKYTDTYKYLSFFPKTQSVFDEIFDKYEIQIELNDSTIPTSYEPYVGGQKSPSPLYPQPIKNVVGEIKNKIQNGNLAWTGWAEDFVERINNQALAKIINYDNRNCLWFDKTAGYGDYENKYIFKTQFKPLTQYTFSFEFYKQQMDMNLCCEYTDGTNDIIGASEENTWKRKIFTSKANKTIKYIRSEWYNGTTYIDLDTFMVLEGTYTAETIPEYVPHAEQNLPFTLEEGEKLCKYEKLTDSGKDDIWGEYIFTGEENWLDYEGTQTGDYYRFYSIEVKLGRTNYFEEEGFCTHFINNKFRIDATGIALTKNATYISISKTIASTTTELKQWIATQYNNGTPVKVLYIKSNRSIVPYNSTQQAQYNAMKQAMSYDDVTYITSTSEELSPTIEAEAIMNLNSLVTRVETLESEV